MSDTSSWWARKLGRPQSSGNGAAGHIQPSYAPTGPPAAVMAPPWPQEQPGDDGSPPPTWVIDPASGSKKLNVMNWQGGRATKTETTRCPNCGSSNFFSRTQGHQGERIGVINQNGQHCQPAPQCAECSYNGIMTIFGGG